jgi:hypothetical protein
MAGNGVPLRNQGDQLADVAFLDFMDTFCSPISNDIPAEQARNSWTSFNLGYMFLNKARSSLAAARRPGSFSKIDVGERRERRY